MNKTFEKIFNPYVLAALLTLVILLLKGAFISKSGFQILNEGVVEKNAIRTIHCDFDNDGYSNKIILFKNLVGNAAIQIYGRSNTVLDQHNFQSLIPPLNGSLACYDYNNDNTYEIYTITQSSDSVFLNILEIKNNEIIPSAKFICRVNKINGKFDYAADVQEIVDSDGDDIKEIYIVIKAGLSLAPRKIFRYSPHNDQLISTKDAGSVIGVLKSFDINNDGFSGIYGNNMATSNYPEDSNILYNDNNAYCLIYTHDLKPLFDPIVIELPSTFIQTCIVNENNKSNPVFFVDKRHYDTLRTLELLKTDLNGKVLSRKTINDDFSTITVMRLFSLSEKNKLFIVSKKGEIRIYDPELKLIKSINLNIGNVKPHLFPLFDEKGIVKGYAMSSENKRKLTLLNTKLKPVQYYNIYPEDGSYNSQQIKIDKKIRTFLLTGDSYFIISYKSNKYFFLNYVLYLLTFLLFLLMFHIYRKTQISRIKKRIEREKEISDLQLRNIKNQIDPHFTLNTLNSISYYILKKDHQKANYYLTKQSRLIRETLQNTNKISVSLQQEIDYLKDYIELQQMRHNYKFDYTININENVDQGILIPKMILQTFVENAIKHGLQPKNKNDGELIINVFKKDWHIIIEITDNGQGRKYAKQHSAKTSTGKGLSINREIIDLYNNLNNSNVSFEVGDLFDKNGKAAGTRVRIVV